MENQDVPMNDVQRALCDKFHFKVESHGDGYIVTDRDPALVAKKKGLPKHRGTDLTALIFAAKKAQEERNGSVAEEAPESVEVSEPDETVSEDESVSESDPDATETEEETETEDAPSNVVSLRRAILTDDSETPMILKDVILDNTGRKTKKVVVKKTVKHRDNRLARAFRAILENPTMTVAEQAVVADVTPAMLGYYEIQLRSCFKIIYEKFGEGVIPQLPKLIKK